MKILINKINVWKQQIEEKLIVSLFTKDEKYLIAIAIDDRVEQLEKISIQERWADSSEISKDVYEYSKVRPLFSTKEWR